MTNSISTNASRLVFLGIELDTVAMQMRLPASKLDELRTKVQTTLLTPTITLQDLQSIIGLLNFACQVVAPGRAFIRRLIDATVGVKQAKSKITVFSWMKLDLEMWLDFLNQYNGITLFPGMLWVSNDTIQLFTDSAGGRSGGFGIFFHNKWAFGRWPHQWEKLGRLQDMTYLELFPVVVALHVWGPLLANKKILFHIDNQAVVYIVNRQTSKSNEVMSLVRKLVLYTLKFNITFKAEYIYTKYNAIADSHFSLSVATFSGFGSICRPNTNTTTPRDLAVLTEETNRHLRASMAESTWQTYKTASDSFNRFRYLYGLPLSWPAPLEHIIQFIASMSAEGKASGSIRTYISGLSYMYKIHGLTDITKSFIVTKL